MKTLQIWHSSSLILPLRHIIWFSCELDCIRFHRGFISDDMLCTCVDRTEKLLLCVRPAGVRPCPDWLLPSPGERKLFSFPFSFPFLHSLSLNCTCLMSWHLFFQSFSPHTHTPSLPLHARSCFFLCLFFFLIQCSSCWHSQCSRRDWGKVPSFAIKKQFLPQYFTFSVLTFTVPYSMPRVWDMQEKKNIVAGLTMERIK